MNTRPQQFSFLRTEEKERRKLTHFHITWPVEEKTAASCVWVRCDGEYLIVSANDFEDSGVEAKKNSSAAARLGKHFCKINGNLGTKWKFRKNSKM